MQVRMIFYLLGLLFYIIPTNAQEENKKCNDNFTVNSSLKAAANNLSEVIIDWDFSAIKTRKLFVEIQVQALDACWDGLNGSERGSLKTYQYKAEAKKSLKISHFDVNAKCIRWRAIIKNGNCTQTTDWKFEQFI